MSTETWRRCARSLIASATGFQAPWPAIPPNNTNCRARDIAETAIEDVETPLTPLLVERPFPELRFHRNSRDEDYGGKRQRPDNRAGARGRAGRAHHPDRWRCAAVPERGRLSDRLLRAHPG